MTDVFAAGRLEDQPFPALAGRIFREGRTGALSLESGTRQRTVWFLGGNPAAVVSDDPEDHIARFLLEHGHINEQEHARLAALPETRDAFAGVDFLPKEALNWAVKFRFVNLCYDLFRWEVGDFAFTEGNPPRDLFLLKVPAHSLIFKGIGYLGRARLLDLAPDEALLAAGEIVPEQARYLGPAESDVLAACRPGRTVTALLEDLGWEDRDRTRSLLYALVCLGLVSLASAEPAAVPAPPAPQEVDAAFAFEEPAGAAAFTPLEEPPDDGPLTLPPPEAGAGPTTGEELGAALAAASGTGTYSFDQTVAGAPAGSFDESFSTESAESAEQAVVPPLRGRRTGAKQPIVQTRGLRFPRLVGIALGAVAGCAIIGAATWWWLGGVEPPPPVMVPAKRPATTMPPAPPAQPLAVTPAPPVAVTPPASPQPGPQSTPISGGAAQRSAPATANAGVSGRYRNGLDVLLAGDPDGAAAIWEDLLAQEHRDDFTLLLLTACQRETIQKAQKALASRRFYLVPKQVGGRNCFRVCADTFDTRDAAARALAALPPEFRTGGATVRAVSDVLKRDR